MTAKQFNQHSITRFSWILLFLFGALVLSAQAQTNSKKTDLPLLQDYKGVKLGMTADEVRQKLGAAQSEDKDGFLYVFDGDETAQILLNPAKKVKTISVMYGSDNPKPPMFADIFGKSAEPEKRENGGLYKLVQYQDAGYWISYNRMSGDKPATVVVIQKMP